MPLKSPSRKSLLDPAAPPDLYRRLSLLLLFTGIGLRLLLVAVTPGNNAFDDHFEPIFLMLEQQRIPGADACWQCFHPPLFYLISALLSIPLKLAGADEGLYFEYLQLCNGFFVIASLLLVYRLLGRLHVSGAARLMGLAVICLLPRHVYLAALHGNDSLAVLLTTLAIYLFVTGTEAGFSRRRAGLLGLTVLAALFTKYTTMILLPALAVGFAALWYVWKGEKRRSLPAAALLALILPSLLFGAQMGANIASYGTPLPWNRQLFDPDLVHPKAEQDLAFHTFTPWRVIGTPIVSPATIDSYWTLVYGRLWFDVGPKFLYHIDGSNSWWRNYFRWLRGESAFPPEIDLDSTTLIPGSIAILAGLVPSLLGVLGILALARQIVSGGDRYLDDSVALLLLTAFFFNLAGMLYVGIRIDSYSAAKATYLMPSLAPMALFFTIGYERIRQLRPVAAFAQWSVAIVALAFAVHLAQIVFRG